MSRRRMASVVGVASGIALVLVAGGPGPPTPSSSSARAPAPAKTTSVPRPSRSSTPMPADDWTFRPTVVVRNGSAQGSGTIIASIEGETLVLTAAHVIVDGAKVKEGAEGPKVELHRYNLGLERFARADGGWPRSHHADLIAADRAADLAVLRIGGLRRLPYVARLAHDAEEPARGTVVTSVGIDLGEHLSSWPAYVAEVPWYRLESQEEERPFVITTRAPEHGRSGGGLFSTVGALVGVCVGRVEETEGVRGGIFASTSSIRRLLRDHDLEEHVARSEGLARQDAARPRRDPPTTSRAPEGSWSVTPTRVPPARPGRERGI